MVSFQGSSNENALHGFCYIEPGASTRRVQEPNAMFPTPLHQITTAITCQVIQRWHSCSDQPVLLTVHRQLAETTSAVYRPCHECSDDLGTQACPLVVRRNRDEEWFDRDLPHLHSTRVNPSALPGRRLVQSPFFSCA